MSSPQTTPSSHIAPAAPMFNSSHSPRDEDSLHTTCSPSGSRQGWNILAAHAGTPGGGIVHATTMQTQLASLQSFTDLKGEHKQTEILAPKVNETESVKFPDFLQPEETHRSWKTASGSRQVGLEGLWQRRLATPATKLCF